MGEAVKVNFLLSRHSWGLDAFEPMHLFCGFDGSRIPHCTLRLDLFLTFQIASTIFFGWK